MATAQSSVDPELAVVDLAPGDKRAILAQLVRPLAASLAISDPDKFLDGLLERENVVSTAVGGGIAVPHTRAQDPTNIKRTCLVLGLCRDGVAFDSLDSKPTYLFWLICTNSLKAHLRLLAKVMLMFRQPGLVDEFLHSDSVQGIMNLLKEQHFDFVVRL
jgi:PTS system nitrogen regulatory IIA component